GTVANGYSVHVLGQSHKKGTDLYKMNLAMVQRENSVIMLDDDYNPATALFNPEDPESYIFMTMMQSAYLEQSIQFAQIIGDKLSGGPIKNSRGVSQDPFYVLWKTSMPSVLVELGFISNDQDLAVLKQEKSRDSIAECLYEAFKAYKTDYDKSMMVSKPAEPAKTVTPETKPAVEKTAAPETDKAPTIRYGVQIATLSKELPQGDSRLLGYKPLIIKTSNGKLYRHVIAICDTKEEAREKMTEIARKYPDCFLVKIESGSVSRAN
ncbi:MAG: N-acetylmuramoyl-L-alanine amidase, partial [Bacteroidales bacterium]|nr:N-acetylmuramoyl-L-alanine amidase [Bacteroidales bacterium]